MTAEQWLQKLPEDWRQEVICGICECIEKNWSLADLNILAMTRQLKREKRIVGGIRVPHDEEYLNDFHKSWNESCMKVREETMKMHFSHNFLKAQSQRLTEQVRKAEEKKENK